MINHARTLLLNIAGPDSGRLGDEYIPPTFKPLTNTAATAAIRNVLFGARPDWFMFNCRARQYLTIIHASELAEFITALDPRVTYDLTHDTFTGQLGTVVTGRTEAPLWLTGALLRPEYSGICYHLWSVELIGGQRARVIHKTQPYSDTTIDYVVTDGLSDAIALPESALKCHFKDDTGSYWTIEGLTRPASNMGEIVSNLDKLPGEVFTSLFGTSDGEDQVEPMMTFKNLWNAHREMPYRLGGILLALIYRMEAIRTRR